MTTTVQGSVRAGTLDEIRAEGHRVVTGAGRTIVCLYQDGRVYAVDNRCPHMGFPLEKGTVKDCILTCHWHHARFDLASGGTFDPFADDVQTFPVNIVDGEVWVDLAPPLRDEVAHRCKRLSDGLEQNIRLVIAKSVLALEEQEINYKVPLRIGAEFGTTNSASGWSASMTMLTCAANILPYLSEEDRPRALYQGLMHVAMENEGKPPRFPIDRLPTSESRPEVFKKWFRDFIDVRDSDGAERCLRTAIDLGLPAQAIADMVFAAATDHIYLDGGHILDFANKAFELLDHIGWQEAGNVVTSLVNGLASARRSEELNSWRHPVDISSLVWEARAELPGLVEEGKNQTSGWQGEEALAAGLLVDDPEQVLESIKDAVRSGASPEGLGSAVAYAAFLRMARFHTSNEFSDWDTVHNTLTAANALHMALRRAPSIELLRAVFDTAMSIYLDRFLNIPAQRIPEANGRSAASEESLNGILGRMDVQQQVEEVADLVSDYISEGNPDLLLATLGHSMLREDLGFHWFQIVDAGFNQYLLRGNTESGRHVLIGMARFLAAHCPTPRQVGQTYRIALRLQRGEEIYRESD